MSKLTPVLMYSLGQVLTLNLYLTTRPGSTTTDVSSYTMPTLSWK